MALKITSDCIDCGACIPVCPNDAIAEVEGRTPRTVIDPVRCTECAGFYDQPSCAEICAVDSCVADEQYPETQEELLAKKDRLHPVT